MRLHRRSSQIVKGSVLKCHGPRATATSPTCHQWLRYKCSSEYFFFLFEFQDNKKRKEFLFFSRPCEAWFLLINKRGKRRKEFIVDVYVCAITDAKSSLPALVFLLPTAKDSRRLIEMILSVPHLLLKKQMMRDLDLPNWVL